VDEFNENDKLSDSLICLRFIFHFVLV